MKKLLTVLKHSAILTSSLPLVGLFVCGVVEAANHLIPALVSGDALYALAAVMVLGINLLAAIGFACLGFSLLTEGSK